MLTLMFILVFVYFILLLNLLIPDRRLIRSIRSGTFNISLSLDWSCLFLVQSLQLWFNLIYTQLANGQPKTLQRGASCAWTSRWVCEVFSFLFFILFSNRFIQLDHIFHSIFLSLTFAYSHNWIPLHVTIVFTTDQSHLHPTMTTTTLDERTCFCVYVCGKCLIKLYVSIQLSFGCPSTPSAHIIIVFEENPTMIKRLSLSSFYDYFIRYRDGWCGSNV